MQQSSSQRRFTGIEEKLKFVGGKEYEFNKLSLHFTEMMIN